ncbi:hypothetical protein ACHAW5_011236 [Stephanodiscus triporus]|uniref:Cysteine/serine-rich nuclear protein N-terminal domain-containing protein n=1 Tax=Stephanodiscus triporus TaxID=2934178 RepID=A0ABD3PPT4_9STRA
MGVLDLDAARRAGCGGAKAASFASSVVGVEAPPAAMGGGGDDEDEPLPPRENGGRIPQDASDVREEEGGTEEEEEEEESGTTSDADQRSPPPKKKKKNRGKKKKKKTRGKKKRTWSSSAESGAVAPDDDDDDVGDDGEGGYLEIAADRSVAATKTAIPDRAEEAVADAVSTSNPPSFDTTVDEIGTARDRSAASGAVVVDAATTTTTAPDAEAVVAVVVADVSEATTRERLSSSDCILVDAKQPRSSSKARRSSKSVTFGNVHVREYARTLGTHVVPADGGWPLGLSDVVIAERHHADDGGIAFGADDDGSGIPSSPSSSSPRRRCRLRSRSDSLAGSQSSSPSSPSAETSHYRRPTSWTVDDFELRRQIELRQRYAQLIRDLRRRKFEKEWERRNMSAIHSKHGGQNHARRNRSRSGSLGGCGGNAGGGGRSRAMSSGSFKVEMSAEDREELDGLLNWPVSSPAGELETRPYDYKRRICHALKFKGGPRGNGGGAAGNDDRHGEAQSDCTEEDELYHEYGGRNPLFRTMREDDRRKALLRDDHLMSVHRYCRLIVDDGKIDASTKTVHRTDAPSPLLANDDESAPLDPADGAVTQRVQHDLEALRIRRSDPANLGCSCRKLHVYLPGSTDRSHHRKKSSHRRLPERKVREELRKRGLLHGGGDEGGASLSREDVEVLLHNAIENEPCCWGNDCPCWRDGIGCQADTCSCWQPSHDVGGGAGASNSSATRKDAAAMSTRCGNPHGMYSVDFDAIALYRGQHVTACIPVLVDE